MRLHQRPADDRIAGGRGLIDALPRRRVLAGGAGLAGALALPGCATVPLAAARSDCPPPIDVALDRVIRTQAGLRPFRPAGFRVEAEQLGPTRLVHNYGHGGSGWTLAWGTARLATALGLPGHTGSVAVIGAGIAGLTTARLAQEAGFPVTIYAGERPEDTTSAVAGGQFHPTGTHARGAVTAEWRADYLRALDYAFRRQQLLVGDDWGVRWLTTYVEREPEAKITATFPPAARAVAARANPFGRPMSRYDTLYTETGRFLRRLLNEIEADGGRLVLHRFTGPAELAALPERLVFNCTGLGARELVGDTSLTPIKGQLAILLPQPEVRYALSTDAGYAFPRPDGIVLGGTWERGVEDMSADPGAIAQIVARHRRFFQGFGCPA